ncbi:polysaccharide pyruvyl transferase family protein [Empedobacter falsenii]|uniref:polysaccharide pyruvyl transferase family protein n=1 Tax=Empedobacter falsenii TaxID=343874 RepID=UPI001C8E3FC6|nr:polysaccharide pyruvyl transferase family protein [Empedobacter falsenii]MBY0065616.1 polysaccharide pyruvyl transferase family protein [Empedobacter falsenii]
MNISVKGAYGDSNFGDDLLMIVLEDYLSNNLPNEKLNFIGTENNYVKKLLVKSTFNANKNEEVLIYGGGTQFFSFIEKSSIISILRNNIKKNPLQIFNKVLSKINPPRKTTINQPEKAFIGFGLGPFNNNRQAINYAKQQLSSSFYVGVRDQVSFQYCKDWNINAVLGADIVFSSYFQNYISKTKKQQEKNKIAIIVRDWEWKNSETSYQDQILKFVENNKDLDFTFIVFAKDKDPKWMKIIKNYEHVIWEPEKQSVSEFLEILNAYDIFITARYHGAIIAGLMNKKVICIEIEPKLRILTEQIPTFYLWENSFDIDKLKIMVNKNVHGDHSKSISTLREKSDNMLVEFVETYKKKFYGK